MHSLIKFTKQIQPALVYLYFHNMEATFQIMAPDNRIEYSYWNTHSRKMWKFHFLSLLNLEKTLYWRSGMGKIGQGNIVRLVES